LAASKDSNWNDPDVVSTVENLDVENFDSRDVHKSLQYFVNNPSLREHIVLRIFRDKLDLRSAELLADDFDKILMLSIAAQWIKIRQSLDERIYGYIFLKKFVKKFVFDQV